MGHILILGGARSGKSRLGEKLALAKAEHPAYIATASSSQSDGEMDKRIADHRARRSDRFVTLEAPLALGSAIERAAKSHELILVDCLTLWLSNLMFCENNSPETGGEALLETLKSLDKTQVILISNEVGQGIVPDNALARAFRDSAGLLHQDLGQICETVLLVTAGLPLALKGKVPGELLS